MIRCTPIGNVQVSDVRAASANIIYFWNSDFSFFARQVCFLLRTLTTFKLATFETGFPCFITNQYDHSVKNATKTCGPFTDMFLCEKLIAQGHPCTYFGYYFNTQSLKLYTLLSYSAGYYPDLRVCDQTSCVQGE